VNPPLEHPVGPDEPMDGADFEVVDAVGRLFDTVDPMPTGLVERIQFAMALEHIDAEVSRMREESALSLAVMRGDEQSRTITFESTSLTIMITLSEAAGGATRFDGWCAPPAAHVIELRTAAGSLLAEADDQGRFVIEPVPSGLAQLVVRLSVDPTGAGPRSVITPAIVV
jgi:hypothetical protein